MITRDKLPDLLSALGFSKRGSRHTKTIRIRLPTLAEQPCFVTEIEALDRGIKSAQAVLAAAPARKQAIMLRYL